MRLRRSLIAASTDWRRLGVALAQLRLDGEAVALDDPRASSAAGIGAEPGLRWTDGAGELDVGGAGIVELRFARVAIRYAVSPPREVMVAA